jgi:hypothetical protein
MRAIALSLCLLPLAALADVNLDTPGAFDALKRDNPDHYRRATGIIQVAESEVCQPKRFAEIVRVQFAADKAGCAALIKTSYPAKFDLGFTLDSIRYSYTATLEPAEKLLPAKNSR